MSAREEILARVRKGISGNPLAQTRGALEARLAAPPPPLVPARAKGTPDELTRRFAEAAERAGASVRACENPRELARDLADFLGAAELPRQIRMAPDRALDFIALSKVTGFSITRGAADRDTQAGLSLALAGVAETGSIMLASSAAHPMSLAFLSETHIAVLPRERIAGSYEEAMAIFRADGVHVLPRAVTFITGPSRSADIEQTIQYGAHGPRRLHIVILDKLP